MGVNQVMSLVLYDSPPPGFFQILFEDLASHKLLGVNKIADQGLGPS